MKSDDRRGFTLIELMIGVAIIGLLAALAIPEYQSMLMRAKRAEMPAHLDAMGTSEKAYMAEWGSYTACALQPPTVPGRTRVAFPANEATSMDWNLLGWVPDGKVYGQYDIVVDNGADPPEFTASARTDIDADGVEANYVANHAESPKLITANNVF